MSFIQIVIVETFIVLITLLWSLSVLGQLNNEPSSPCPSVFQYIYHDNEWYGDLEVPSPPIEHREVILYVTLSLRASTNVSELNDFMIDILFFFFSNREVRYRVNSNKIVIYRTAVRVFYHLLFCRSQTLYIDNINIIISGGVVSSSSYTCARSR